MDKNTIWAIVLSALVLFVSFFIETAIILPKQQQKAEEAAIQQEIEKTESEEKALIASESIFVEDVAMEFADGETIPEEKFTITTNKVKVVFTNKGGDIISYQLLEHFDKDTGHGVEMVDNITDTNRAFALAFGDANGSILNETFNVKKIDDYTIGFFRDYIRKDENGNPQKFNLAKLYTFKPNDYVFKLDISINTEDGKGLNVNDAAYTLRTSPQIGPHFDTKQNRYDVRQFISYNGAKKSKHNFSDKVYDKTYVWAGVAGKYFCEIVNPIEATSMEQNVKTVTESTTGYQNSQVFLTRAAIDRKNVTDSYYIYVGPRSERELIKYNSKDKNEWSLFNAKYNEALQTSSLFYPVERALKWAMEMINRLINNWGISIIILTILLKLILFPLNKKSAEGTVKMQQLQPKMQAIQEKYKDNKEKLSEETTKLYKEAGYNPASGCLPMVLQMFILIALYNVFNNYFEFRGTSFIKGWIDDLSVGDCIWQWEKQIPLLSSFTQNSLRILPILYTATSILNSKITQNGGTTSGQNEAQMKFMTYGFPVMIFFMFYNTPSGLLLYWNCSNILQVGQQLVINKIMAKKRKEEEAKAPKLNKNVVKFKGGKKKSR